MHKNIFVVGLDEFNYALLKTINPEEYRFHPLLRHDEVQGNHAYPIEKALRMCEEKLRHFPGSVDAIIGYWDFPVSDMVPFLCAKFNLPAPTLESTVKCEHKYWCRVEQTKVVPEHVPPFYDVDPHDETSLAGIDLPYPYWLKPIKGTDSELAFKIQSPEALRRVIPLIRERIDRFALPFNHILQFVDLPEEAAGVDGRHCIAEGIISGKQCTVEGYVYGGEPYVHGIIDSLRYPGMSSFFRYQYPSRLSTRTKKAVTEISRKTMRQIGLNNSAFNIEFFVDEKKGKYWLLEVNPRISQSHAPLFEKVDGAANHEIAIAIALGRKPDFPSRQGGFPCAAKFYVRVFKDGTVTRTPTEEELDRIRERFPGTLINVLAREGDRLSEMPGQDAYSYRIALIYMGAKNTRELLARFRECRNLLSFEFAEHRDLRIAPLGGEPTEALAQRAK